MPIPPELRQALEAAKLKYQPETDDDPRDRMENDLPSSFRRPLNSEAGATLIEPPKIKARGSCNLSDTEKVDLVERTLSPGVTVSMVARDADVGDSTLFRWRRLYLSGELKRSTAAENAEPTSNVSDREDRIRLIEQLIGRLALENELLRQSLKRARDHKRQSTP